MIRFAMALVAALATTPALASDLVLHEVLSEQPLSDATDMKVVIERVTVKPGGEIERKTCIPATRTWWCWRAAR